MKQVTLKSLPAETNETHQAVYRVLNILGGGSMYYSE